MTDMAIESLDDMLNDDFMLESILLAVPILLKSFPSVAIKSSELTLALALLNRFQTAHPIFNFNISGRGLSAFHIHPVNKRELLASKELNGLNKNLKIQTAKLLINFLSFPDLVINNKSIHYSFVDLCKKAHSSLVDSAPKEVSLNNHFKTPNSSIETVKKLAGCDLTRLYNYLSAPNNKTSIKDWFNTNQDCLSNINQASSDRKRFLSLNGVHIYYDNWWLSQCIRLCNNFINYLEMNLFLPHSSHGEQKLKTDFLLWQKTSPQTSEAFYKKDGANPSLADTVDTKFMIALSADLTQSILDKKVQTSYLDNFLPTSLNKKGEVYKNDKAQSLLDISLELLSSLYNPYLLNLDVPSAQKLVGTYKESLKYLELLCKTIAAFHEPSIKNKEIISYKSYSPYVQNVSKNVCIITQAIKDNDYTERSGPKNASLEYMCAVTPEIQSLSSSDKELLYKSLCLRGKNPIERLNNLEQKLSYLNLSFPLYFSKSKNLLFHHNIGNRLFHSPITFIFLDYLTNPVRRVRKLNQTNVGAPGNPLSPHLPALAYKEESSDEDWQLLGQALEKSYALYKTNLPAKRINEAYLYDMLFHFNKFTSILLLKSNMLPIVEKTLPQFIKAITNIFSTQEAQKFLNKLKENKLQEHASASNNYAPSEMERENQTLSALVSFIEKELLNISVPAPDSAPVLLAPRNKI